MPDEPDGIDPMLKISGIADPKCKCTPNRICRRCESRTLRCGPKYREPWSEAVKIDKGGTE